MAVAAENVNSETKGLVNARPLEFYSSLHELSLNEYLGLKRTWIKKHLFMHLNLNLHVDFGFNPQADLTLHLQEVSQEPQATNCCCNITGLKRWRLDISSFDSFSNYEDSLERWHRCNYSKSDKKFKAYGCEMRVMEPGWIEHVDTVYLLYSKVAQRYKSKLYNRNFFYEVAQRNDYKLITAWFEGRMIGMFLLQDESPTLHSGCCGFDYEHSSKSYAYSWLHYEIIRFAIEQKKYRYIDIGLTGDEAKRVIGFKPYDTRMDVYVKNEMISKILRMFSSLIIIKIKPDAGVKFKLKWY